MTTFQKIFKNGGHFEFSNFRQKCEKHKNASISLTVRDRAISSKFSTPRVSKKYIYQGMITFQKIFKNGGHFEFSKFSPKIGKHKIFPISLTVGDRAISAKFSTPRVFKHYMTTFQKIFKNGGHFEFSNFRQKCEKHKIFAISLTVRDRAISAKFLNPRVFKNYR